MDTPSSPRGISERLEQLYRTESRRILATLIRLLGDFDLAEDGMHDAFGAALTQWARDGVPEHPRAWLISAGRMKAIDRLRRRARFETSLDALPEPAGADRALQAADEGADEAAVADDQLRLIFICCHPALPPEARAALTLREVCGLTTEEIARAYLASPATVAQRIVRAKARIREERLPYELPSKSDLPARLGTAMQVIYLVFNEGYFATSGVALTRADLSGEAIRLARHVVALLPEPEAQGLLALLLLHDSRRAARTTASGELVLLEDQDRARWDAAKMDEGRALVRQALATRRFGAYTLQAAIAAVHADAPTAAATDWPQIADLYGVLLRVAPSPVVELNRAVAVAMRDGPQAGVALIEAIFARGDLAEYPPAHAALADLCRRLGRTQEAGASYRKALSLTRQGPERTFLERRLAETLS